MRKRTDIIERLLNRVEKTDECWNWTGSLSTSGYGQITGYVNDEKTNLITHRVVYEHFKGKIPKNHSIDHLCRNKLCQNPEHLEAVTPRVNTLRGVSAVAINAQKTHCSSGHPLSGKNLLMDKKNNVRMCKACRRVVHYNWRLKRGLVYG